MVNSVAYIAMKCMPWNQPSPRTLSIPEGQESESNIRALLERFVRRTLSHDLRHAINTSARRMRGEPTSAIMDHDETCTGQFYTRLLRAGERRGVARCTGTWRFLV